MSSQRGDSLHNEGSGFVQPDATNVSKSRFTPKPIRARKQFYDPSLAAEMGPPDVDMTAGAPNTKTKQQRAPMEDENRARENATKDLTFKLAYLKTRSSPNDAIMQREPAEFAKEWASEIWKRSMQNPDATIRDYNDAVYSVLQGLDEMEKQWDKAKVAEDGKEWTGQALSESIDTFSSDTSSNDIQAQTVADSDSRNPATRVTEDRLNADQPHEDLSLEEVLRKSNRRGFRQHIKEICALFKPTDQMSHLDAIALAASWETRLWVASSEQSDRMSAYNDSIAAADQDFEEWKTFWESTECDDSGTRTGRQFFLDYVQHFHAHELQYTTRTGSLNEVNAPTITPATSYAENQRRVLRNELVEQLLQMKALLPISHELVNFDARQVARTWESQNWSEACQKGFDIDKHVADMYEECEELAFWSNHGNNYPNTEIDMTGEARFSQFIRRRLGGGDSAASALHDDT